MAPYVDAFCMHARGRKAKYVAICPPVATYGTVSNSRQNAGGVWLDNEKLSNKVEHSDEDDCNVDTDDGGIQRHLLATNHQVHDRRQHESVHQATQRARKPATHYGWCPFTSINILQRVQYKPQLFQTSSIYV